LVRQGLDVVTFAAGVKEAENRGEKSSGWSHSRRSPRLWYEKAGAFLGLAELVGASRLRTTEQLNDCERPGVIAREGRRLIIVLEKLWQLAQTPHPA